MLKGKYLINTDNWFIAPDGKEYKAVWGHVEILSDSILGVSTNRNATNWYAKIGSDTNHVIVAGCQIHYATLCNEKPNINEVDNWTDDPQNGIVKYKAPSKIYITE